jgi:hypothetical protein
MVKCANGWAIPVDPQAAWLHVGRLCWRMLTWLPSRSPGKSHPLGLSTRHQARRISTHDIAIYRLRDAQCGGVAGRQDRAMLEASTERGGYQNLEDIEPITVAVYIEILQRRAAPPTLKQHMAAIRMLFSWLTEKGVLAMNPAREVKTERFSRAEGKTPAFVDSEVQKAFGRDRDIHAHWPPRSRPARHSRLHLRPDRCRRESEGRRLLSVWETVFSPIQRERWKGERASRAPQVGGAPG